MSRYAQHFGTRVTPQTEKIPGSAQVPNSADGFSFAVDKWKRLERFLILGSEGGSYYASEKALTVENATNVQACIVEDPARTVAIIVAISDAGRAPKNDPALFALAMVAGYKAPDGSFPGAAAAFEALPKVARIGTHLFQFAESVQAFRGWGRGLRKAIAAWYTAKEPQALAYQMAKYQQRNGWAHRDLLRLSHPSAPTPEHDALFRWAVGGFESVVVGRSVKPRGDGEPKVYGSLSEHIAPLILAMEAAKHADVKTLVKLIAENDLPRECVPTEHLNSPEVWEALLIKMPLNAMVRNLGKMTSIGLLKPMSAAAKLVADRLGDENCIKKSRLHPLAVLLAAKTYATGHGLKGSLSWTPVSTVNDALDGAFYKAFANVDPTGKRTLLALDVSGSMGSPILGTSLNCAEGSAAMAMITAKTEPLYQLVAFTAGRTGCGGMHGGDPSILTPVDISRCSRIVDVINTTRNLRMGGTDCALPMVAALQNKWDVDTFIVYTDSETWHGSIHPCQALVQYRQKTGIPAKLIVVGMASNGFSIADPNDAGMLDCCGFDASTPAVMADFARD